MRLNVTSRAVLSIAVSASAYALGIRLADQDAEATARGNAFAATADNPAAIYYNPAGITQLAGWQARLGLYTVFPSTAYRSPEGRESWSRPQAGLVPQLYATWNPEGFPLAFGLGCYSPYGLSLEWPQDTGFRTVATRGRVSYWCVNPVVAWRVERTISLAAGLTVNYAETDLRRGILRMGDEFGFEGEDSGVGFNAGARWQLHPRHVLGVSYRSETRMEYEGELWARGLGPEIGAVASEARARFPFPQQVVLGWSYRPTPKWNLEFNADWTDWDGLNTVVVESGLALPISLAFNWESSWFFEWGVTRQLGSGYQIAGGYIFSENSVPERDFTPLVPDSDRHIFSVGVSRRGERLWWAISYQFAYGMPREIRGSRSDSLIGETADGWYHSLSHAVSVSAGYAF